jgi:hypothetical protein
LFCLLAAVVWSVLLRIPLIENAAIHLDSDLAVDGLTLQEAVAGHWRWHYPGTPFMGIGAVLLSWPQAMIWGVDPMTLVSGGVLAHVLVLAAVFGLAWRVCGRTVAMLSLLPLTLASTGTLWLSARITGGHLLIVAWSAVGWLLLHELLSRPSLARSLGLGLWCGLGVYLDSMFVMTLAGMLIAAVLGAVIVRPHGRKLALHTLAFCVAFLIGSAPKIIGARLEPYDAYRDQFATTFEPRVLVDHARILFLDCVPRLIAGHRLPGFQADPDPALLGTDAPIQQNNSREAPGWVEVAATILALMLAGAACWALGRAVLSSTAPGQRIVAAGVLATGPLLAAGFLINRNIFNSDNYRYLALLLIPWPLGFGLAFQRALDRPGGSRWVALLTAVAFVWLFTWDAAAWYRRMGWIDERYRPVRRQLDDPALRWLEQHPEVRAIFGGYWDVYRLSFLTGGSVKGIPFSFFPDRFPELAEALPDGRPETALVRRSPQGLRVLGEAIRDGGQVLHRESGLTIVSWPYLAAPKPP